MNLCDYGCGNTSKFILNNGKKCCVKNYQSCPNIRKKNSDKLKLLHTSENSFNVFNKEQYKNSQIARFNNITKLPFEFWGGTLQRQHINNLQNNSCSECGLTTWLNKEIKLELDHINGDHYDNRLENLRLLCPNCHSQTDTFRGRNINSGTFKVTDDEIKQAILQYKNIYQALISLKLAPKGGNYKRFKKIIQTMNLPKDY